MLLLKKHRKKLLMFVLCIVYVLSYSYCNDDVAKVTVYAKTIREDIPVLTQMPATTVTPTAIITEVPSFIAKKVIEPKMARKKKNIKYKYANTYVRVRKKASKKSAEKFLLKPKQKVKVLKKTKKWTKVKNKKGTGYVLNKTLSQTKKKAVKVINKRTLNYKLTGYCPCYRCSEGWGTTTLSGRKAKAKHTIAADLAVLPLYTDVYIEGMGIYTVEDKGGGVSGRHIDVYCNKHSQCYSIKSNAKVFVIE